MVSSRNLIASLAFLSASAIAQTLAPVAFTSVPAVVVAGSHYNISWGGGDGSPVTLTLRKGDPQNLATIGVLADAVQGTSYDWIVSDTLHSATDYALQITQGQAAINYSGQFTIMGGSAAGNSTVTSSVTSSPTGTVGIGSNATATSSSTANATTTAPVTSAHSTTTAASTGKHTGAPNANAAAQYGSSAALVMGITGAILFLN